MDVHAEFTASDAPILCLVCTSTACGSQLVATVNVRLETTLADVRSLLVSLASGGDGGAVAVREAPTNVSTAQAQRIVASPLHPFDFTETFSFVHGGGCRLYSPAQEAQLSLEAVLPRYPRFGVPPASVPSAPDDPVAVHGAWASSSLLPAARGGGGASRVCSSSCTQWLADAAPPVAVVQHPRRRFARRVRGSSGGEVALQHHDGGVSEMSAVPPQKRLALAALFVAPGDRAEGGLRAERVVAERLQLQLPDPLRPLGGYGSGAGLFSATALSATYGRPFRAETWSAGVTRWNGNTEDLLGRTLLFEAAQVGNEAAVRFLLSQSYIVVDSRERQSGETPLHAAVRGNHPTVVKLLLEEGSANPLLANTSGDTPLHLALQRRRAVLVGLLCGRLRALKIPAATLAADSMLNRMGYTPAALFRLYSPSLLDMCRDGASLLAIKALVHHYFFEQREVTARDGMTGQSVLHAAAAGGSVEVLRYVAEELHLLAPGVKADGSTSASRSSLLYDSRRQNPLHVAVAAGEPACVQYLLQKLPLECVAEQDVNGNTPLLLAMKRRAWRVVELLLAQCPPGSVAAAAQDRHGLSALHFACGRGMTRIAAALLRHHGALAHQSSLTSAAGGPGLSSSSFTSPPPLFVPSSPAATALWGPHWENTTLVRHGALRGRLLGLEEREAKRQAQLKQRQRTGPFGADSGSTALTLPGVTGRGVGGAASPFADYSDAIAIVHGARHYAYGGGRLGYTPLRCLLLYATHSGGTSSIPLELLRLLCEHGALHDGAAADTRDLLFFLLTHRADANAEMLLEWVVQQYAAALAALRRDNVLLCRLCALHDDVGVRWCVEAQLCDLQSRVANPLVACAAAGDAAAAAFLIQCGGADVNAITGPHSALDVALRERQVEVAQLLLLSRAHLSSGDGSWTALRRATSAGLESVMRGLLGSGKVDALDVAQTLTAALQGLLYASPAQKLERARLALYLARAYDPTRSDVHPTELLHLSAAVGCLDVTHALVDRLLALPSTVWAELLAAVPPPPPRPAALIEPTMAPLTIRAPRLLPNRVNGKGGLYRPPKPFYRLVVPAIRTATAMTLLHRVKVRDVYSYAAAARQVELVQVLRCGLRLPPWPQPDVRGWTVMDYVMAHAATARTPLLPLFVAAGVAPAFRHGRRVLSVGDCDLVRAVHEAQQERCAVAGAAAVAEKEHPSRPHRDTEEEEEGAGNGGSAKSARAAAAAALEMTAGTLARLIRGSGERSLALVCDVLDAFLDMHHLTDFKRVPCPWLGRVVLCCAEEGRLDVLTRLREHYNVDLAQDWLIASSTGSTKPSPLLMAVQQRHMAVVSYLLRAGCAVHARSSLTAAMAARVPLKNSESSLITPLALAAWRQDYVSVRLLLAASPPLRPEDTEENVGHSIGDALHGLVAGAPAGVSAEQQAAVADCVRALARAGHPLRWASTVRTAMVKRLLGVAEALLECYGSAALSAELSVAAEGNESEEEDEEEGEATADKDDAVYRRPFKHAHLTALAYVAATPRFVPLLRSLLVERVVDAHQLESWRRTDLSAQVLALHRHGGRRGLRITSAAVDFALRSGCGEGAVLLLALGLMGRGVLPRPQLRDSQRGSSLMCVRVAHVLRHWHARRRCYQSYTVLHSAAELGYGDVVDAVTAEVQGLHRAGDGDAGTAPTKDDVGFALVAPPTTATVTAPSLYALAATHVDGWAWLPCFERVEAVLDPRTLFIAARDLFALIFSGFGVSRATDLVCRRAAEHKLLGDMFDLFEATDVSGQHQNTSGSGNSGAAASTTPPPATRGCAVSPVFAARQLQLRPRCFYLAGGRYLLTGVTALTCAIAAGSFDWVQYLAVHGPSLVYHRAAATRLCNCADRTAAATEKRMAQTATGGVKRRLWRPRDAPSRRPRPRCHHCDALLSAGAPPQCEADVCRMDALTLCMTMLADAVLCRRDSGETETREAMTRFLLAWPAATPRKETINLVAIVAAVLRRWPLLLAIMQHADQLYAAGLMSDTAAAQQQPQQQQPRYFFPLLPEEIPAVLARVVGSVRHVMHAVARWAPKEVLIEVARHCQRSDVEAAVDARGCTSVYHALHHRQPCAIETFAALRVPLGRLCRTRQQQTPLMVAAASGCTALIASLLRPERVNQQDREGRTALMLAAAHGHRAIVELLLAASADVSICDAHGRTAVMVAALRGHDEVAVQLVQHFSHPSDLVSSHTSVLHCAAVGGCWRTAAAALKLSAPQEIHLLGCRAEAAATLVLREDGDGHTPLYLAHAFGSARVLRTYLQALFHLCDGSDVRALQGLLEAVHSGAGGGGAGVERRLLRSDSALERYGWLSGVLEINAALAERVRQTYADSPAARDLRAGEMPYLPVATSLCTASSLLQWCVQTRNTVGLRVLADFNVADDCGALHLAAANGSRNVVELLVELEMSDPSAMDAQTRRYPFEHAALHGQTECASYLLANTVIDLVGVVNAAGDGDDDGYQEQESADCTALDGADQVGSVSAASVFHVLAGHCGGELLIQFVEQTLRSAARTYIVPAHSRSGEQGGDSGAEVVSVLIYRALQRRVGSSRLTALEYAMAMGDPAAVLRTAQVLQRLQETAGPAAVAAAASPLVMRYDTVQRKLDSADGEEGRLIVAGGPLSPGAAASSAVFVSASFLQWLPTLSPAVRTVLFDVFGMWEVANVAGFGAATTTEAGNKGEGGGAQQGSNGASPALPPSAPSVRRLRFGDVRLLGIAALQHDPYCAEVVYRLFNPDHEREVLRLLLQDVPFRIRYEPESYRQCSLALQTQLLQWLGSSLVLGTYDAASPCGVPTESWAATSAAAADVHRSDFESVEVQVVRHRSEQYVELGGGGGGSALLHSLYVSSAQHALVVPDVMATMPAALRRHRESWRAELNSASEQATRLLRRQPHPVLQRSVVTIDWDLLTLSDSLTSVTADVERYGDVFSHLRAALRNFCDWVRGPLNGLLTEVDAADLNAVVVSVRHGAATGSQVCFRYVAEERAVTRFPRPEAGMSVMTFKGDVYPSCCIEFNEVTHTDVAYACNATIGRAVAGDVALVRVHHARDSFLRAARAVMAAPRGVATSATAAAAAVAATAEAAAGPNKEAGEAAALNRSTPAVEPSSADPFLRFKLELEGTTLDQMPLCAFERLLHEEAVAAIDAVVSPCPPPLQSKKKRKTRGSDEPSVACPNNEAKRYDVFHSAAIVSAALVRRLKTVLVLFTSRRSAMVRLSGDKLMLCFTPHDIPSCSDIVAEVTRTLVQEESDVYRRRLAEVFEMMQQRLTTYLPQARLAIDLAAMERLATDKAHLLSAMRLLVHQRSTWVLQRLIEGVSIGWDTDLGAVVRRHVRQVSVTLEPGLHGSCYLSPDGVFVYYCPLLCLERQPPGVLTPSSLPAWQLLSAQHIASMLLLQLAVVEPQVPQFVDRKRSVACWTVARRLTRRVVPGGPVVVEVQAFNLLRQPHRRGGERLRIMGEVGAPAVEDKGKGCYHIRFDAPQRAGAHRLFVLLHGQPIADSPLWFTVRPGPIDLARTSVEDAFDAVVVDVPFTVVLALHDTAGNRLHAAPKGLSVHTTFHESLVRLERWALRGLSALEVTLRVSPSAPANAALAVPLVLSLSGDGDDAASETIILPAFPCVDLETYQRVCRVRQGLALEHGSPTTRQAVAGGGAYPAADPARPAASQPSSLYFRRSVRRVMRKRLASEATALGGALGYRYPRSAVMERLARGKTAAAMKSRKSRARNGGEGDATSPASS